MLSIASRSDSGFTICSFFTVGGCDVTKSQSRDKLARDKLAASSNRLCAPEGQQTSSMAHEKLFPAERER
jgi:hypothetical protein